nr:hypothetical protein [Tanacetum cinerariifolium]
MPVCDIDIEDVIEEEEGFVGKKGFGGEEDNIEDGIVVANDLCYLMIQTTLNVDFDEDINTKSHVLMSFGQSIVIKFSQSSFKFFIRNQYQERYLKAAPMDDKFVFKMIKVCVVIYHGTKLGLCSERGSSARKDASNVVKTKIKAIRLPESNSGSHGSASCSSYSLF